MEGAELVAMAPYRETRLGPFWRFFASDDPEIRRFLRRAVDSRLGERERIAVRDWIEPGRSLHLMRDHPLNGELVLGGMWGGRAGLLPDVICRSTSWTATDPQRLNMRYDEPSFLRSLIWPLVPERSLMHDSSYRLRAAIDFPPDGPWTDEGAAACTVDPFAGRADSQ